MRGECGVGAGDCERSRGGDSRPLVGGVGRVVGGAVWGAEASDRSQGGEGSEAQETMRRVEGEGTVEWWLYVVCWSNLSCVTLLIN